jgi:hypothetical protein
MLVTQSTLVGYTIINGTYSLQLAMLVGCVFNFYTTPSIFDFSEYFDHKGIDITEEQAALFNETRKLWLPIGHATLVVINFISGNPMLDIDAFKAFASFIGMIL